MPNHKAKCWRAEEASECFASTIVIARSSFSRTSQRRVSCFVVPGSSCCVMCREDYNPTHDLAEDSRLACTTQVQENLGAAGAESAGAVVSRLHCCWSGCRVLHRTIMPMAGAAQVRSPPIASLQTATVGQQTPPPAGARTPFAPRRPRSCPWPPSQG